MHALMISGIIPAQGETKEKCEHWKQLTTAACELIEVKEPDHMGTIRDQQVIDHVMLAMKPMVAQQ